MTARSGWGRGRLKWDADLIPGGTPSTDEESYWLSGDNPSGIPFVAISDMSRRATVLTTEKALSATGLRTKNMPIGEPGTLLLAMYASVGEVAFLNIQATWNQAILGITPNPERVESRFLAYILRDKRAELMGEVRTNTQMNLNARQVGDLWFQRPPLQEQRQIADYLDRETAQIDTLIEAQQQLVEMLRERRASAVQTCLDELRGGLTRLKYQATVQTGVTLSGAGDDNSPEWPYLRVANVQAGFVDTTQIKHLRLTESEARASLLQRGDVLMTEGGDIDKLGRGSYWSGEIDPCLHQNHVFSVRPGAGLDPHFLVYLLDGPAARTYFRATARKTTNLASTNKWTLGNLPLRLPTIEVQQEAVAYLDEQTAKIDTLIAEAERFIELSRERRSALITAAVTGQIDVRDEVA